MISVLCGLIGAPSTTTGIKASNDRRRSVESDFFEKATDERQSQTREILFWSKQRKSIRLLQILSRFLFCRRSNDLEVGHEPACLITAPRFAEIAASTTAAASLGSRVRCRRTVVMEKEGAGTVPVEKQGRTRSKRGRTGEGTSPAAAAALPPPEHPSLSPHRAVAEGEASLPLLWFQNGSEEEDPVWVWFQISNPRFLKGRPLLG